MLVPRHGSAPDALRTDASGFRVTLSADAPAFFVWLDAPGVRGEFSDNSIALLPGEPRTVAFSPKDPATTPEVFRAALETAHLAAATSPRARP